MEALCPFEAGKSEQGPNASSPILPLFHLSWTIADKTFTTCSPAFSPQFLTIERTKRMAIWRGRTRMSQVGNTPTRIRSQGSSPYPPTLPRFNKNLPPRPLWPMWFSKVTHAHVLSVYYRFNKFTVLCRVFLPRSRTLSRSVTGTWIWLEASLGLARDRPSTLSLHLALCITPILLF